MSARDAELLEDEVRTLQARCAQLEEDLRRTKLDAYQVALERDALRECVEGLDDAAVPVAELRELTERWEVEPHHTLGGYLLSGIRGLCAAADLRAAAAKPAEGGETGGAT
jgi:HPt (histidine-containing phosphotransfer) domain-containing protein